jgi:drug/metabolite transporter (DMT)-like permease
MAIGNQLIIVGFILAACAFLAVIWLRYRLKYYVSRDKVRSIEDASQLWTHMPPPAKVLNNKGLRIRRYARLSFVLFFTAVIGAFLASILENRPWPRVLLVVTVGSLLAGTFFESRLKYHVSIDSLRSVEDVASLWMFGGAPGAVLNEKGHRLNRKMKISVALFFIGMSIVVAGIIV